ncbi:MAG: hypothetical protein B6I18_02185, partial [Bacteroidetes bacterium 4572_112]
NLESQTYKNFKLIVCVNQPDIWWDDSSKIDICEQNIKSIDLINKLASDNNINCTIIDKTSKGKGWQGKNIGVGWARKTIMDHIALSASDEDIIVSLDADTYFKHNYFAVIHNHFANNPQIETISGSAISFRYRALKKIGGFSPKKSGEDFYFIQKMIKYKPIGNWLEEKVYPAARFSDRVSFGTGPAMIKGNAGNWESYPLYPIALFDKIKAFFDLIPQLYTNNIDTPIDAFWKDKDSKDTVFEKLRKNNKDLQHFTKAVHDYFDGLRTLQFLKANYNTDNEEANLIEFLNTDFANKIDARLLINFSFNDSSLGQLDAVRDFMVDLEDKYRKQISNS